MEKYLTLSVHQLVDFLLRTGDIDNRVFNRSSMTEGSRLHSAYQSKQSSNYMSEFPLKMSFNIDEVNIVLEGRADGIIKRSETEYVIDEIKTTVEDLKTFHDDNLEWHLGQAKCYAYMFAKLTNLEFIGIKLTYIRQGKEKEEFIDTYHFNILELEQFVVKLLNEYLAFYNIIFNKNKKRDESIEKLKFPFKNYRQGQRELAKYAYAITKKRGRLFVEAPTGIGKTMSTLFPFIKAIPDDENSKIFYLTAKTSGKEAAHNAIKVLKDSGLSLSDIVITAKDKVCFCKGSACNHEECPYTFQTWFMKNKCCGTCRIYNWDYAMMFTPFFFLRNAYAWSLLAMSIVLLVRWEITFYKYPERFAENTNEYLRCRNCPEKLCTHKTQLQSLWRQVEKYTADRIRKLRK